MYEKMSKFSTKLTHFVGVIYSLSFSVTISGATVVLVNSFFGCAILLWHVLQLNRHTIAKFCSAVLRTWFSIFMGHLEYFGGLTIVLTGDAFFANESALVVCNHRSWADTVVLYSLARQVRMHGDVKFLAKRSLLLFPVFGFAGWILDVVIFIKRQSSSAGRRMGQMFSSLTDPRRGNIPYWIINYLEGTRFSEAKHRAATDFAKQRDLDTLQHLLQPRTKGFVATVHALQGNAGGNAQAVYDVTIGYQQSNDKKMSPLFVDMYFLPSRKNRVIHVHQRRIPLSELPKDDDALKNWVYALYKQKDDLLHGFRETGTFNGRPMRWNRITLGYWIRCQFVIYSLTLLVLYLSSCLFRFLR